MTATAYLVKKSISWILRDELDARGIEFGTATNKLGLLVWVIGGEQMGIREAADKFLEGGFAANV